MTQRVGNRVDGPSGLTGWRVAGSTYWRDIDLIYRKFLLEIVRNYCNTHQWISIEWNERATRMTDWAGDRFDGPSGLYARPTRGREGQKYDGQGTSLIKSAYKLYFSDILSERYERVAKNEGLSGSESRRDEPVTEIAYRECRLPHMPSYNTTFHNKQGKFSLHGIFIVIFSIEL